MTARLLQSALALALMLTADPALAQITVLDQAQDNVGAAPESAPAVDAPAETADAPPPVCGTKPVTIARMGWPSAELLAEIHAEILRQEFGCDTATTPGDLAATGSSMGSTGQPAVAPEMWVTRIADVWNAAIDAQMVRPAAPSYEENQFEGWFIPDYLAAEQPQWLKAADLATTLPAGQKTRLISCPADWACSIINRNLVAALGLGELVDIVEPANRFEMDTLIAEAVSRKEAALIYYWQPNAVMAQFKFAPIDLGAYDEAAAKCLAQLACADPKPSAFATETVVVALADWVFTDIPAIAGYFQRTSMPLGEMNTLLAQLNEPGATVEGVAAQFVRERKDIWNNWLTP